MAARLINGMRAAFHAENFDDIAPEDFLTEEPTQEDFEKAREKARETLPTTLDE